MEIYIQKSLSISAHTRGLRKEETLESRKRLSSHIIPNIREKQKKK